MMQAHQLRQIAFGLFVGVFAAVSPAATLATLNGGMELTCQFVNNSATPDNQVYILITARDASNTPCFVNANGGMSPIVGGQNASMYAMTLSSFTALQFPPMMTSARLWISYGAPMNMATFAGGGLAQPNLGNPGDPNINTVFDWMEFNVGGGQIFCNTTQVDMLGIPYTMELYDDGPVLNSKRGIEGCYADIKAQYLAYMDSIPGAAVFKGLAGTVRIVAPAHGSFATGQPNANYFDAYIASVWAGPYRPAGVAQPSTQDVFMATGPLATQAAVNAAINRHVIDNAGGYGNTAAYYQTGPANYYAAFFHQASLAGKAYGFAYDDANDQSSLQVSNHPRALVITLGGCVPTPTPTFTRTRTPAPTFTRTLTATPSSTPSATSSSTSSATASRTSSATSTRTPSATPSATASATLSATATRTSTATASATPSLTASATATGTASASATVTPSAPATQTPSATTSVTASATPSGTASGTISRTPSATLSGTATWTSTPSSTATVTLSQTLGATLSSTPTVSRTPSPSPSRTATGTLTGTSSATPSRTASVTAGQSFSPTPSPTPSMTLSASATRTLTASFTATPTNSPSAQESAMPSPAVTVALTLTPSPTMLASASFFQQERLIKVLGLYPNPFAESAHLYFTLRVDADLEMRVYNVAGEPIWSIRVPGRAGKNLLDWDGSNGTGGRCASGAYLLRLVAQGLDHSSDEAWIPALIQR